MSVAHITARAAALALLLLQVPTPTAPAWAQFIAQAQTAVSPASARPPAESTPPIKHFAPRWAPPDIDEAVPPVAPGIPCPLPRILDAVGQHLEELAENLPQFTATERLEQQEAARKPGTWRSPQSAAFEYLAQLREVSPGMLQMEEIRNGRGGYVHLPGGLADVGLPAVALVFHPYYVGDYDITCEGQGQWEGRPAWQLYFQQRPDRPARLREYVIDSRSYPVKLKGRAWIDAESFQLVHLETDLLEPVPRIRLAREHVAIDYRPVYFQRQRVELWLPNLAEVHMDFGGHRYRRRHSFSDFLLFSVDVKQQITEPKAPGPF